MRGEKEKERVILREINCERETGIVRESSCERAPTSSSSLPPPPSHTYAHHHHQRMESAHQVHDHTTQCNHTACVMSVSGAASGCRSVCVAVYGM